jgi:hypothetical protein
MTQDLMAKEEKAATVFGTDVIFSLLMAAPRSVYSWDCIVRKQGRRLVFDKVCIFSLSDPQHSPLQYADQLGGRSWSVSGQMYLHSWLEPPSVSQCVCGDCSGLVPRSTFKRCMRQAMNKA